METKVKKVEKRRDGKAESVRREVAETTTAVTDSAAQWIREYRVAAVAGAFVTGFLIGVLLRR